MLDIVAAEPEHADLLVPYLKAGITSPAPEAQSTALVTSSQLAVHRPDLVPTFFPWVEERAARGDTAVRVAALLAGSEMVAHAPQFGLNFVPLLTTAMQDPAPIVRVNARVYAGRLALQSPALAEPLLPRLMAGADDADEKVQVATQIGLSGIIRARRDLAASCEPVIEKGLCEVSPDLNTAAAANVLLMREYGLMTEYAPHRAFGAAGGKPTDNKTLASQLQRLPRKNLH